MAIYYDVQDYFVKVFLHDRWLYARIVQRMADNPMGYRKTFCLLQEEMRISCSGHSTDGAKVATRA